MGKSTFLTNIPVYPLLHNHPKLYIDFFSSKQVKKDRSLAICKSLRFEHISQISPAQKYAFPRFAQFGNFYEITTNVFFNFLMFCKLLYTFSINLFIKI